MKHYFESDAGCEVVAYCMDRNYMSESFVGGLPVVPFEDIERFYSPDQYSMFVAVGYSSMRNRVTMFEKAKDKNYKLASYVSSSAVVDRTAHIGDNNAILQSVQVEPFVQIGDNNIVWSSSNICHDVVIENHSFIAAKSIVGGFSRLGNNCFVGFNSTIINGVHVADESLVGASSLVISNTKRCSKNIGIPAKEVSFHFEEGIKIK